jgi:hypothetical protein
VGLRSEEVVYFSHGVYVVGFEVYGEAGIVEAAFLAWSSREVDAGPCSEVAIVPGNRFDSERANIMKGLREGRIDGRDSLLDDVKQNYRLRDWSNQRLNTWEKNSYLVWVGSRAVHPVGPVDDASRLFT